jgi:alpha/beta superfamily hydrolase
MAQPVVYRTAESCRQRGLASLRFNFRGVGQSRGTFSGTEEVRDVEAAAAFLSGKLAASQEDAVLGPRTLPVVMAGYSFGSVMVSRAAAGIVPARALALIAFVVDWDGFPADTLSRLAAYRGPVLAVCAEHDEHGRPEEVARVLRSLDLDLRLEVVKGVGHFLEGRHREVGERVAIFFQEVLAGGRAGLWE